MTEPKREAHGQVVETVAAIRADTIVTLASLPTTVVLATAVEIRSDLDTDSLTRVPFRRMVLHLA